MKLSGLDRSIMHPILFIPAALGIAVAVTYLVHDEGLNLYGGGLGFTLVGVPAFLYGAWCLFRGEATRGLIWLSVRIGFAALVLLTPLGEACRHRGNIRLAKRACAKLLPYLADMKVRLGAYPPSVSPDIPAASRVAGSQDPLTGVFE